MGVDRLQTRVSVGQIKYDNGMPGTELCKSLRATIPHRMRKTRSAVLIKVFKEAKRIAAANTGLAQRDTDAIQQRFRRTNKTRKPATLYATSCAMVDLDATIRCDVPGMAATEKQVKVMLRRWWQNYG